MIKHREFTEVNSCFNRAAWGEMTFVLLGRDAVAGDTIRYWVERRIISGKNRADDPQIIEALQCAAAMDEQHSRREIIGLHPHRRTPELGVVHTDGGYAEHVQQLHDSDPSNPDGRL